MKFKPKVLTNCNGNSDGVVICIIDTINDIQKHIPQTIKNDISKILLIRGSLSVTILDTIDFANLPTRNQSKISAIQKIGTYGIKIPINKLLVNPFDKMPLYKAIPRTINAQQISVNIKFSFLFL